MALERILRENNARVWLDHEFGNYRMLTVEQDRMCPGNGASCLEVRACPCNGAFTYGFCQILVKGNSEHT